VPDESAQRWRVGTKVPVNVYEGDRIVCQCQRVGDATRIVDAMNKSLPEAFDTPESVAEKMKGAMAFGDIFETLGRTEKR
jgi:hypothetical protein